MSRLAHPQSLAGAALFNPDGEAAADAITRLRARVAELDEMLTRQIDLNIEAEKRAYLRRTELERENERLHAGIERIAREGTVEIVERIGDAYSENGWRTYEDVHPLAKIARAILSKESSDG